MQATYHRIRSGYDGKRCLVHARCAFTDRAAVATAQPLDVTGDDLFSGIMVSVSLDGGKSFGEFRPIEELSAIKEGENVTVCCDATPFWHKSSGRIILIGQTAEYERDGKKPTGKRRRVFYSVADGEGKSFSPVRFFDTPGGYVGAGCGSGQCVELPDGEVLVPVNLIKEGESDFESAVIKCSFDGEKLTPLEMGGTLTVNGGRGLYEPSLIYHGGEYLLTLRNDYHGYVARSKDGLNFFEPKVWRWDDGEILANYNTQQHWLKVGDRLALSYTRSGANNDHIPRHRAPIFVSFVNDNLQLERNSEIVAVPERGARLGNFCSFGLSDGRGAVMAAEWMQPAGCEKYGSDNSIFLSFIEE